MCVSGLFVSRSESHFLIGLIRSNLKMWHLDLDPCRHTFLPRQPVISTHALTHLVGHMSCSVACSLSLNAQRGAALWSVDSWRPAECVPETLQDAWIHVFSPPHYTEGTVMKSRPPALQCSALPAMLTCLLTSFKASWTELKMCLMWSMAQLVPSVFVLVHWENQVGGVYCSIHIQSAGAETISRSQKISLQFCSFSWFYFIAK